MRTTARTRVFALLGNPVAHSLSPLMQNAAFLAAGIDAVYVALQPTAADVAHQMAALAGGGGGGNVTLGDLNGDGKVNVQDATTSLRIAVGSITPTDAQKAAGDVNHDGKWNVQDTTLILRVAVGAITAFP